MTDDFLTKGLQNDRYLKALRLADEFENQIEARLRELGQRMIAEHPDLFEANPDGNDNTSQSGQALAHTRVDYSMTGEQAAMDGNIRKLNVHLYWVTPTQYDRTDVDGALHAFGYKIKNADSKIDDRVAKKTQAEDWPLQFSKNPYGPSNAFYRHVSSAAEIEETAETLVDHFATFGREYAATLDEQ